MDFPYKSPYKPPDEMEKRPAIVKPKIALKTFHEPISVEEAPISIDQTQSNKEIIEEKPISPRCHSAGCSTQGYDVSKTMQFIVKGTDATLTCFHNLIGGCYPEELDPVPIAGSSQIALSENSSFLLIVPGIAGQDNDDSSIDLRIALAQYHLEYEETVILFVKVPSGVVGVAQADIRKRLWCFARILALYSAFDGSGIFLQVPPALLAAVSQVLSTPTADLSYVRCIAVCLDPQCDRDPNACPAHKAPLCDVFYPCEYKNNRSEAKTETKTPHCVRSIQK
jgi:hypothetical protein